MARAWSNVCLRCGTQLPRQKGPGGQRLYCERPECQLCSVDGCGKRIFASQLCRSHEARKRVRGTTDDPGDHHLERWSRNLEERFFSKVDKTGDGGCWLWLGCGGPNGYGQMQVRKKFVQAHRVSYMLQVGPIPEGLELDHLCTCRAAVNQRRAARRRALRESAGAA